MSIERISIIQTASAITQPVDTVENLTLIEKLENEVKRLLKLRAQEKPHNRYGCGVSYLVGII